MNEKQLAELLQAIYSVSNGLTRIAEALEFSKVADEVRVSGQFNVDIYYELKCIKEELKKRNAQNERH